MYIVKIKCVNCGEIFQSDNEDDQVLQLCADCQDTSFGEVEIGIDLDREGDL